MSRIEMTETCGCGASFTASGDYPNVGFQQDAFHRAHKLCRERSELNNRTSPQGSSASKEVEVSSLTAAPETP